VSDEERLRQLVAAHDAVFTGLLDATAGLDGSEWATPTGCPGWDVHDQLAHCIGVERMMLGDPPPSVEVPDLPHLRNDMGRIIEMDVHVRRGVAGDELRAEARETFDRRLAALEAMTVEDLTRELDSPIGRHRASKVLRTRVFDLVAHEQDIRRALQRETELVGAHAELALEQVVRAWAALLPARVTTGGTVAIEIAGRQPVLLDLGAGDLHRGGGPDPDVTIALTPGEVISLGCGREDAPGIAALPIEGDRRLARSFLAAASVTP
jgi:uncharacterized protein (TIGR03083 family)